VILSASELQFISQNPNSSQKQAYPLDTV